MFTAPSLHDVVRQVRKLLISGRSEAVLERDEPSLTQYARAAQVYVQHMLQKKHTDRFENMREQKMQPDFTLCTCLSLAMHGLLEVN